LAQLKPVPWTGASQLNTSYCEALPSAIAAAYAAAAAVNLPPTATNHVTVDPLEKFHLCRELRPALQQ